MTLYEQFQAIDAPIPADRQGARRHYGVHPYFTRRPFNVVRQYIQHYSREGDRILDPFGGSGVSAIEALLSNRIGIQNDINPLANFIATGIADLSKGSIHEYAAALGKVRDRCEQRVLALDDSDDGAVELLLKGLRLPENVPLPANADVQRYHELFSRRQLAALAIIREAVDDVPNRYARSALRLAWSATLAKVNRTFLSAEGRAESRGGSSIFSIYRYKVAAKPVELSPWATFHERAQNVLAAKEEIDREIDYRKRTGGFCGKFEAHNYDIDDLRDRIEPVDYIFTDPPYGGHISYIDLSTLWNAWNGTLPSQKARQREMIVGGDLDLSEDAYLERLHGSILTCFDLLKPKRWLSVVFQHWSPAYFDAILTAAAEAGSDLRAAISQLGDPIWSMHKKKGKQSVLAGELILTFVKTGKPKTVDTKKPFDVEAAISRILDETPNGIVYGEYLLNRIVVDSWKEGALGSLDIDRTDFADIMERQGWSYDNKAHQWRHSNLTSSPLLGAPQGNLK
ncbi:MAG TPA: DNA methyltransferase [Terriglobales bacterium]|jgi:16S rRNA G966 N2-methylase RsmD|nr:DNA methyltransferase [Terriglobales bacterium]